MKRLPWFISILAIATPLAVYGWSGSLYSPGIAPGLSAIDGGIQRTLEFLQSAGFTNGNFLNERHTMSFAAPTSTIGEAVRVLTADADLDVTVAFAHFGDTDIASFRINQNGPSETTVVINLDHPDLDLSQLNIVVKAPTAVPNMVELSSWNQGEMSVPDVGDLMNSMGITLP